MFSSTPSASQFETINHKAILSTWPQPAITIYLLVFCTAANLISRHDDRWLMASSSSTTAAAKTNTPLTTNSFTSASNPQGRRAHITVHLKMRVMFLLAFSFSAICTIFPYKSPEQRNVVIYVDHSWEMRRFTMFLVRKSWWVFLCVIQNGQIVQGGGFLLGS